MSLECQRHLSGLQCVSVHNTECTELSSSFSPMLMQLQDAVRHGRADEIRQVLGEGADLPVRLMARAFFVC